MSDKTDRKDLEIEEIRSRVNKMMAETAKLHSENKFYPLIVGAIVTLAIVAIAKIFL